ncbi:phosphoglycerate mutase family protein [Ligilactobacillus sp. WILCCON 0076]|uniref:Phosphoglycerate mutase family protein n=1 Tax=Ligilactobacillus ubinensis TaxID=2876789 RepID=A0A9X2FJD6_9LACO|nr:histidine phosphatase family protein [Ligilactobacillus ubinensis]MCP0886404.1 phosphoglycerate mutase family protein [Ligilactobacillus ubinensis]
MTIKLYMVRHGQTILNLYNRLQGWCDSPLTKKGIQDAQIASQHLQKINFDVVYHTNTIRTRRTSQIILDNNLSSKKITPIPLPYFREQGFGYFEAADANQTWLIAGANHGTKTYDEILQKYSFAQTRDFLNTADPFKKAETDNDYWERLTNGFAYLRNHCTDNQNILLVTHSITTRSIVDHFAPELGAYQTGPRNGAVTKLELSSNDVKVVYYNHYLDTEEY